MGTAYRLWLRGREASTVSSFPRSDVEQIVGALGYYVGVGLATPHPFAFGLYEARAAAEAHPAAEARAAAEAQQGILSFQFDHAQDVDAMLYDYVQGNFAKTRATLSRLELEARDVAVQAMALTPPLGATEGTVRIPEYSPDERNITLYPFDAGFSGRTGGPVFQRVTLARFARAVRGQARAGAPDVDDHGYKVSPNKDYFRPARGPTLGMTLGERVRVRVVRDRIANDMPLFLSDRSVGGGKDSLHVSTSIPEPAGTGRKQVDPADNLVFLSTRDASTPAPPNADDLDVGAVEEENESVLVHALEADRLSVEAEREPQARKHNLHRRWRPEGAESELACLRRNLRDWVAANRAVLERGPLSRAAPKNLAWAERVTTEVDAANQLLEDIAEAQAGDDAPVKKILAGVADRSSHWREWASARRMAQAVGEPEQHVVKLRLEANGPTIAELAVVAFPPLDVEVAVHIVSLGPKGRDDLHLQFDDPHGENISYPQILRVITRANAVLATCGVRLRLRKSAVLRYRLCDATVRPRAPDRRDDPQGLNRYIPGFRLLFPSQARSFAYKTMSTKGAAAKRPRRPERRVVIRLPAPIS